MDDSLRLKALCKATDSLFENFPDSANALADTILKMTNNPEYWKSRAAALRIKGEYFQDLYEYETSLEYLLASFSILEAHQEKLDMTLALDRIGDNYLKQHDYLNAQEYFQQGLILSREIGDTIGIAMAYKSLGVNYYFMGNFGESLNFFNMALALYEELGREDDIADMYTRLGAIYYHQGNYTKAIQYLNKYFEYDKEFENLSTHAEIYTNLGAIYFQQKDYIKAKEYYEKGLAIDEQFGFQRGIAIGNFNIGECFLEQEEFPVALEYFQKSLSISKEYKEKDIVADCFLAMGLIHKNQGEYSEASVYYQKSLEAAQEIGYNSILSSIYIYRGDLYNILSEHRKALTDCISGMKLANESGDIQQRISACDCLYKSYKALGNASKALEYHETFLALTDSLHSEEAVKQLQQLEFNQQMLADSLKKEEEKLLAELVSQKEISNQRYTKNILIFISIGILIMSIGLYSRLTYIRKSRSIIQKEKEKSENLLLNILPSEVAEELKLNGESVARNFEDVTVLFTDFKGFTNISEILNAQELVAEINICFKAFDQIITSYGIEKIKTIGDAYLAAGGLHRSGISSVKEVVMAGLEMQSFMDARKAELQAKNEPFFEMRVGIHTGQVVAGIVGVKKFQYDIWGDTVNIASRMESSGGVGKVNISETTYKMIKDDPEFIFESRGKIQAKNKGDLKMYFVGQTVKTIDIKT